jgi:hypothetical protein
MNNAALAATNETRRQGEEMNLKLARLAPKASAIFLTFCFLLYLAASRSCTIDLLAAVLSVIAIPVLGLRRSGIMGCIKPLTPLNGMYFRLLHSYE